MAKLSEHLEKIIHEINWIGLDGHLDTLEKKEIVNEISIAVGKARKVFEKDNGILSNNK